MNFEASRAKALDKLNYFVENNLSEYSKLRNFDFGPENRSNISCLSPYITHGIINEKEVIEKSLGKFDIVFLDPPYKNNDFQNFFEILKQNFLNQKHLVIIHREKKSDNTAIQKFNILENKIYGRSEIFFLKLF